MPEQPADPIHYDMRVPPEPKHPEEQHKEIKKDGDKINTGDKSNERNEEGEDKSKQDQGGGLPHIFAEAAITLGR